MRFRRIGACAAVALIYLALSLLAGFLRQHFIPREIYLMIFASALFIGAVMLSQFAFVVSISRLQMRPSAAFWTLILSVLALIGLTFLPLRFILPVPLLASFLMALSSLLMMLSAASLGYLVSFIAREPNILLPIGLFAAMVDFWGVNWGPVSKVIAKAPQVVSAVSVPIHSPVLGLPTTTIGVGDFVFMAFFFGILYRFSMNIKGAFWLGYTLLLLSMAVVMVSSISVPALVPMAIAVLAMNIRWFRLSPGETRSTAIVGVLLAAALIAVTVLFFK